MLQIYFNGSLHKLLFGIFVSVLSFAVFADDTVLKGSLTTADGAPISNFGRDACDSKTKIKVVLDKSLTKNNLRVIPGGYDATDPAKAKCSSSTISAGSKYVTITPQDPSIEQGFLLSKPSNSCSSDGNAGFQVLCIYEDDDGGSQKAIIPYSFDTRVASVDEEITDIVAVNGKIHFKYSISNGTATGIEVCFWPSKSEITDDDCNKQTNGARVTNQSSPGSVRISGLTNGTDYSLKMRTVDSKGKKTAWPSRVYGPFTPIEALFPTSVYDGEGGELACTTTSGSSAFSFALILLTLLFGLRYLRRSRSHTTSLFLCLVFVGGFSAQELRAEFGQMSFGITGSMYRPDLDSEIKSSGEAITPFYGCFFRRKPEDTEGAITPLMGIEMDWTMWDGFGSLELGFGVSYTYASGLAVAKGLDGKANCSAPIESLPVSLHMYQFRPQLTYIFDPYISYFPLAPYIRGALIAHGYSFRVAAHSANAEFDDSITTKPNGMRFGYEGALGLRLMLDFLEPSAVRSSSLFSTSISMLSLLT